MTYSKPEVLLLGHASSVIESACPNKNNISSDSVCTGHSQTGNNPAYDLDE